MWAIKIPRMHATGSDAGVLMFFDVEVLEKGTEDGFRASGFRLVRNAGGTFLGFPSVIGKDGKRYPSFTPSRSMAQAIQARAEQELQQEAQLVNR
jgi:hypothetical protein